ncbi:MAG TPA: oligoendopeptidase F [Desulfobacterales bacterium]
MASRTLPDRNDISVKDRWDLTPLFSADAEWESLYQRLESEIEGYSEFRGRLGESVSTLRNALDFHMGILRRMERVYTYAHLKSDEDKANQHYLGMHQRAVNLFTRAGELCSFFTPEIQAIPGERMDAFLQDQVLETYRFFLEKILRYKPHTLTEREEQLLAMSREMAQAAYQVFGQLDNADLKFGTIVDVDGTETELSHGNFTTLMTRPDRELRQKVFSQYYDVYDAHRNTLAATLGASVKKDDFFARVRNFESCRAAGLFGDNIPETVYDNLIQTVRDNLAPLFKYLNFRKKVLDLPKMHFYDTYVPIVSDVDFHMDYETAVEVSIASLAPLGRQYAETLRQGLLGGWVDRYENRGKRSGAYSSGCYDSPPYILLNYEPGNLNSLYTLVHEAGHSMHSHYSKTHRPYVDHDYTIFVAEVASTFNEDLLSRHLLRFYENDPRMKAYILNREIDNIRATLFRQTMFAEFEKRIHNDVENHRPLTLETLRNHYRSLLDAYFGDTIVIDSELELECLRIPHFYSAFYVYKYATGVSAAIALAEKVAAEEDGARDAYLDFLKLGGSKFPLDQLLDAGVDMRSPDPIQRAIERFDNLVEELIKEYSNLV